MGSETSLRNCDLVKRKLKAELDKNSQDKN